MFILRRQDVEISTVQHPKRDQKIAILRYQDQAFRLISVFSAAQEDEAKAFWRDLTDNRGKACVLLEEPERYSVWGKVRLDQVTTSDSGDAASGGDVAPALVQAILLILQAVYIDIEDLLGDRQVALFQEEVTAVFKQWSFPQAQTPEEVNQLLTIDPLASLQLPEWQEHHMNTLLQELHRIGKDHFGNANFTARVLDALQDMPEEEQQEFMGWLGNSPVGKVWQ